MSFSPDDHENTPELRMSEACLNLDNQFLSMQELSKAEGMRVYARVRPILNSEIEAGFKECIASIDDQTVRAVVPSTSAKYRSTSQGTQGIIEDFTFTSAFGPETGQFVFFEECMMNTMLNFIEGQNSLVFSYGSTGSGKTFTLQGNSENPGIIPLSLHLFFATLEDQLLKKAVVKPDKFADIIVLSENDRKKEMQLKEQLLFINEQEEWSSKNSSKSFAMVLCDTFSEASEVPERQTTLGPEEMAQAQAATLMKELSKRSAEQQSGVCNIWVSFAEIYNENVYDLLQPNITQRNKLNLGEDKNGDVYVKGLQEVCVSNCYEALKLLTLGQKNLKIASTKLNYQSSRSHCIFTIKVIRIPDPENVTYAKVNRLSFCDLAGSERAAKSQTTGIRLKEAGCINTSLLVLGRCLEQLRSNPNLRDKKLIPFRESKLTRLFSGFFTGKGKAMMVINASPSELTFDETLHVLRFSAIAKELIINDSYIATASSTLQTITNMWTNARANRSNNSSDRSISFEDSMEELQEKDELIEKLLDLAESLRNNLEKEKKEKAELEIKIRQEVYQDYSKYSDELLENQKRAYEEECETVKEIYKKRISSMEKMYEKIIKDYKTQLEESESSEDESYDVSKIGEFETKESKVDVSEISPKKTWEDLVKTEISENETDLEKESDNLANEIEALKKDLWNVTEELKVTNEELQKAVDHATSLESVTIELEKKLEIANMSLQDALNENDELKKRNDYLQTSYQEEIIKLESEKESSAILLNENEIKEPKVKYDAAQLELQSTLDKRGEMLKEFEALEIDCVFYKTDNKDLQKTKSILEEKLQSLLDELAAVKNEKQSIQEKCAELENETASHNDEVQKLNAIIDELNELQNESQAEYEKSLNEAEKKFLDVNNNLNVAYLELEEEKNKSGALENDLASLNQNFVDLQNENQDNVEIISAITKELDDSRLENTKLNERLAEAENSITSLTESISDLKNELSELNRKQLESEERLKSSLKETAEAAEVLEAANKALNCATMMTEERDRKIDSLETECGSLKHDIADLEEKYANAALDFDELMNIKGDLAKKCATSKEECVDLIRIKEDLEKKYDASKEECADLIQIKEDLEEKHAISTNELADLMRMKEKVEQKYTSATRELEIKKSTDTPEQVKMSDALQTVEEQAKDIRSLIAECMHLKEDISALQETNVDLNNKLSSANASLNLEQTAFNKRTEESEKIITELKEYIMKSEQELSNLKNIEQEKEQLRENIEKELNEAKEKLESTSHQLKDALENIQKQTEEMDSLKTEVGASKSLISELKEAEIKVMEQIRKLSENPELNEAKETLESTNQELKNALENIQKQTEEMNSLKTEIDSKEVSYKQELDAVNAKLEEGLSVISKQEKDMEVIKNDFSNQQNEIALLFQQKLYLEEKLDSQPQIDEKGDLHKQELDSLNARLDVALNTIESQQKELESLQNNCAAHKEEISQFELLKKDLEEKLNSPELECDELRSIVNILQKIEQLSTKRIKELHSSSITHVEQIMDLERTIQAKESSIESLKNDYSALQKQFKDFQVSSKKQLQTEKQQLTTEIEDMKKLKKGFEKENKVLKSKLTQLQIGKQQLTTEIEDMKKLKKGFEKENKVLKSKLTQLQTQMQQLTTETKDMEKLKKDVEGENKELKSKLIQLEEEKYNLSKEAETSKNVQNKLSKRKSSTLQLEEKDKLSEVENLNNSPKRASRSKSIISQKSDAKDEKEVIVTVEVVKKSESENVNSQEKNEREKHKLKSSINKTSAEKKHTKGSSKKADSIEENQKQKENANQTRTLRKQNRNFSGKSDNIDENQKQKENVNQERKVTRRQLRNLENVPVDVDLIFKDSNPVKTKSSKRKVLHSSSEEKSPLNKLLKKIKLNDVENMPKPQNLRFQVLKGKIVKNETSQPSPRLTRGRKRLFNSELFQSKENALENKSRRAVRW